MELSSNQQQGDEDERSKKRGRTAAAATASSSPRGGAGQERRGSGEGDTARGLAAVGAGGGGGGGGGGAEEVAAERVYRSIKDAYVGATSALALEEETAAAAIGSGSAGEEEAQKEEEEEKRQLLLDLGLRMLDDQRDPSLEEELLGHLLARAGRRRMGLILDRPDLLAAIGSYLTSHDRHANYAMTCSRICRAVLADGRICRSSFINPLTLPGLKSAVLARIGSYLGRTDLNSYGLTCFRICNVVDDPELTIKPWPLTRFPFTQRPVEGGEGGPPDTVYRSHHFSGRRQVIDMRPLVFFSDDGSRIAAYREDSYVGAGDGGDDREDHGGEGEDDLVDEYNRRESRVLEVYDRDVGFLGLAEVNRFEEARFFSPVFSPCSEWLLGPDDDEEVYKLPPRPRSRWERQRREAAGLLPSVTVSSRNISFPLERPFAFLEEAAFCCLVSDEYDVSYGMGIQKFNITTDQGRDIFLYKGSEFLFTEEDVRGTSYIDFGLATFISDNKRVVAYSTPGMLTLFDLDRNVSAVKELVEPESPVNIVYNVAFTKDGSALVVAGACAVIVIDCRAELVEDIVSRPPATVIEIPNFSPTAISCSPVNPSRVALSNFVVTDIPVGCHAGVLVIDVFSGAVLLDGSRENPESEDEQNSNTRMWELLVG